MIREVAVLLGNCPLTGETCAKVGEEVGGSCATGSLSTDWGNMC